MKYNIPMYKYTASFLLILLMMGCISQSEATPLTLPNVTEQTPTLLMKKVQLTYVQNNGRDFDEFYVVDITCVTKDKICFDEPRLLFSTLPATNNDRAKPTGPISNYSWSPNGNKIVLSAAGDIFIGDMKASEWANVTNSQGVIESDPKWSSDGNFIFYRACSYELYNGCRVFRINNEGKENLALLDSINISVDSYSVSPDGQKIVFSLSKKDNKGYSQLYESDLDGSNMRQITSEDANSIASSYSPDGQKIVFVRTNNLDSVDSKLQSDVIVKDLASGEEKNLTENFEGETSAPVFSFAENWLMFYSFNPDLSSNIFFISLDQNVLIQVTQDGGQKANPSWRWSKGQ